MRKHVSRSATPIRDEAENVAAVVLLFRDMRHRKHAEQKLQDALDYATNIIATLRRRKRTANLCTTWATSKGTSSACE